MSEKFDLAVIGAGPGGYEAALEAARLGMRTALVEKDSLGGTCLNRGCIPTKTLLHSAQLYSEIKGASRFGVSCPEPSIDMMAVNKHKLDTVETLQKGIASLLKTAKVKVFYGTGKVTAPGAVEVTCVDGEKHILEAEKILLATGSVPSVPPIPGADLPGVMTSDRLLGYEGEPFESLLIIGGGVIGVEFAGIYNALGTKVTILEALPSLIANMDKELGQSLKMSLKKKGVDICADARVMSITPGEAGLVCTYSIKGKEQSVCAQAVLIATGRRPFTAGLFAPGCEAECERGRIIVDENYKTSVQGIYAIGDVSGKIQLAHAATVQGICAVRRMKGLDTGTPEKYIPACLYTSPEIASVGMTADEAKKCGLKVQSRKVLSSANGKSVLSLAERGFIKVVYDADTHVILGCQMLCERATDMISEFALALNRGLTMEEMEGVCRPHPTFSEMITESVRI